MNDSHEALIEEIRTRYGAKAAITDSADVEPWLTDWRGRFHGKANAILSPASTEEVAAIVKLAGERRIPLVPQAGGSISAEHGIGQMKRGELERLAAPGDLAALRAIKKALDPLGLMNPGKLV